MNPINNDSIIEFIGEFFSELPPTAVAAISGIGISAITALCGYAAAYVVAFFAYAITQSGMLSLVCFISSIVIGSILGLFYGYRMYKNIKLAYKNHKAN